MCLSVFLLMFRQKEIRTRSVQIERVISKDTRRGMPFVSHREASWKANSANTFLGLGPLVFRATRKYTLAVQIQCLYCFVMEALAA